MKFNSFLPVLLFSGIASSTFADDGSTSACDLSQALDPTSPCSLEDLSDAELEQCCLERGFELARQGGAEFSHAEYVEAAKQCLELEQELNKLLEENPELLAELEAEQAAAAAAAAGGGEQAASASAAPDVEEASVSPVETQSAEEEVSAQPPVVEEEALVQEDKSEEVQTSSVPPTSPPTPNESDPAEVLDLDNDFPVDHGSPDPTGPPGNPEDSSLLNPAGLSLKELWDGFKAKVMSDVNMVADKIIPAPLRDPVKGAVKRALTVTKSVVDTGVKTVRRTVTAFIDEKRKQMEQGKEEEETVRAGL